MKTVSVIIPNYNHGHYLANAINSILTQSFVDYEIIVVDDGSTDNSREVASSFGEKICYIWQENKGLGGARNTGILASNSEFISLLDADDEWEPDYLEQMVHLAQKYPSGVVYYCCAQGIDEIGNLLPQKFGQMVASGDVFQNLLRANFIIPSTVMLRRAELIENGLFEQDNKAIHGCEDWDLWLRLAPTYPIVGTSECLVRYRLHQNTFSAHPGKMQGAVLAVIEKHYGPDDGNENEWASEKKRAFGGVYRYHALSEIQNLEDWESASRYLRRGLEVDPSLALDLDLFYEMAFGKQSPGYRGTEEQLNFDQNSSNIVRLLENVFQNANVQKTCKRQSWGTAYFAIALAAYNTGKREVSRHFFIQAIRYRSELLFEPRVTANLLKTYLHPTWMNQIKSIGLKQSDNKQ